MTLGLRNTVLLTSVVASLGYAQSPFRRTPRFQDYPVTEVFRGRLARPILKTPEERRLEAIIGDGLSKGWGVFDGTTGKELRRPGPNFAEHYVLVNFGCGNTEGFCLGAPIVDGKTGRVYRPPAPQLDGALWRQYFGVLAKSLAPHPAGSFHNFRLKAPLAYRLNSRLLITDTCEGIETTGGSIIDFRSTGCGAHYYLMEEDGLKLIYRIVE